MTREPELTNRQIGELKALRRGPLWKHVPPGKADPDLALYIEHELVRWISGVGYRLTDAGHAALSPRSGEQA